VSHPSDPQSRQFPKPGGLQKAASSQVGPRVHPLLIQKRRTPAPNLKDGQISPKTRREKGPLPASSENGELDGRERPSTSNKSFSLTRSSGTSSRDARRIHPRRSAAPPLAVRRLLRPLRPGRAGSDHRPRRPSAQGETAAALPIFAAFLGPRGSQVPRRCHAPAGGNSRPAVSLPPLRVARRRY